MVDVRAVSLLRPTVTAPSPSPLAPRASVRTHARSRCLGASVEYPTLTTRRPRTPLTVPRTSRPPTSRRTSTARGGSANSGVAAPQPLRALRIGRRQALQPAHQQPVPDGPLGQRAQSGGQAVLQLVVLPRERDAEALPQVGLRRVLEEQ